MTIDFLAFSTIVADTPERIRRGDVYRLLEASKQVEALPACADWLRSQRNDLAEEITDCLTELS